MAKTKLALVGIGKIAVDQHVPSINASPDWELAATVSRHGRVAGVESFEQLPQLLEKRSDIDVISLCVPPAPRFEYAAAALKAGKHVMLEKPPGATLAECYTLEQMAKDAGLTIYATWHSRQAAMVPAAKAWLEDKEIKSFTMTWKEDVRRWHPGQNWIFEPGGMGVFDPGINGLSILTEILPEAPHITRAVLETPENRQTPVAAELEFYYPGANGASAALDWLQDGEQTWTIEVETTSGNLKLTGGGAEMQIDGEEVNASHKAALSGEYPRLYSEMARLVGEKASEMDMAPMILVADAFALGERKIVAPFNW